jgi:ubiquinone/menaquinone biosynthesis C-methylase UbiE
MKTSFRTHDYLHCNAESSCYYLKKAEQSGLTILKYVESDALYMQGFKRQFLKYYISTMVHSVKDGQSIFNELKRIISVIFWR